MIERGTSPKSLVVCCGEFRFELSQVEFGSDVLCGTPCFPFYRPRESTGYSGGREENERKKSFKIAGSFFSYMRVPLTL